MKATHVNVSDVKENRMSDFVVLDSVTNQGYGTYSAATGSAAVLAASSDFDRTPVNGDVYHVYELLPSGTTGVLSAQSVTWPVSVGIL